MSGSSFSNGDQAVHLRRSSTSANTFPGGAFTVVDRWTRKTSGWNEASTRIAPAATTTRMPRTFAIAASGARGRMTLDRVEARRRGLHVGREVLHLLHLPHLDRLVLRRRAARRPRDGFLERARVDHPVAAQHFLRLGER